MELLLLLLDASLYTRAVPLPDDLAGQARRPLGVVTSLLLLVFVLGEDVTSVGCGACEKRSFARDGVAALAPRFAAQPRGTIAFP